MSATRLFVGNLPVNIEETDLISAFSNYGEISALDLKSKPATGNECNKFAFISISASNVNIESCIQHYSNKDFKGHRLYVTRARESFLDRLKREREEAEKKEEGKVNHQQCLPKGNPIIKLSDKLNPKKRRADDIIHEAKKHKQDKVVKEYSESGNLSYTNAINSVTANKKKDEADRKRLESLSKKRQEFKERKKLIKIGLMDIDKTQNKKLIFADDGDLVRSSEIKENHEQEEYIKKSNATNLFDDEAEDQDNDMNFEIKKQFEGKKGQKVLDLQSRYKSDKRFTLDERFVEDEEENTDEAEKNDEDVAEMDPADEKAKQLDILQNVLGITIRTKSTETDKKNKSKLGMLRFDPTQPDHAKFLAPVEEKPEPIKKSKKKSKDQQKEIMKTEPVQDISKVEVSKEQFYKVSDTLKEAIVQSTTFSLRSLFGNNEIDSGSQEQHSEYIPLETTKEKKKLRNPLDPTEKNPFVYDSSDSEIDEPEKPKAEELKPKNEDKAVWKENLFFSKLDPRLKDGLAFFSKTPDNEIHKERRELKSLMKKRIYNKDRKNQMFKKKIGGRKKTMKKAYKK